MGQRRLARTLSFQYLYRLQLDDFSSQRDELIGESPSGHNVFLESFEDFISLLTLKSVPQGAAMEFSRSLIEGVLSHYKELVGDVSALSEKKALNGPVELTLVLLGLFELKYRKDIPSGVVINEYIELAKKFGKVETSAFVNGLLDRYAKQNGV